MDLLITAYPWIKALHIMSVIAWMAGLFYLPRLFVYHAERGQGNEPSETFKVMEEKLLVVIMRPAAIAAWVFGLLLVLVPGAVEFGSIWPWTKLAGIVGLTYMHVWLAAQQKEFARGENKLSGRTYRIMNEVPTLLMVVIVLSVVVRPF